MKKLLFAIVCISSVVLGRSQTNMELYEEFKKLNSEGKNTQAIEVAGRLVPKANTAGDTLISLNTSYLVSEILLNTGQFYNALQYIEPAWKMAGDYYKNTGQNYGVFCLQLGFTHCKMGDADNASYYLQQGHDLIAEETNEEGPIYIIAVQKMADCMMWFSQPEAAGAVETLLALTEEHYGKNSEMMLIKLRWARDCYNKLGDEQNTYLTDKEILECSEALKLTYDDNYRYKLWDVFNAEAKFYNHTGAERILAKLDSLDAVSKNKEDLKLTLNNKINYYTQLNRLDKSFGLVGEYVKLVEGTVKKDTARYVAELNNIGTLYIGLADYGQATKYLENAYKLAKQNELQDLIMFDKIYLYVLFNLGRAYSNSGQYVKSIQILSEYRQLSENPFIGKNNKIYYQTCLDIGVNYQKTGEFDSAETYFNEALQIIPYIGGATEENVVSIYQIKGSFELAKGNYDSAAEIFSGLLPYLTKRRQALNFNILSSIYLDAVLANYYAGRYDSIAPVLQKEYTYYRNFISDNFTGLTEAEKSSFITQYEKNFAIQQAVMFRLAKTHPGIATLWYDKLLLLKGITLYPHYSGNSTVDSAYLANTLQYKKIRETLAEQMLDENADPQYLKQLQFEANELERKLFINKPDVTATWETIKSKLKKGEAAVEFIKIDSFDNHPAYYAALLLTPSSKQPQLVELCNAGFPEEIANNKTRASKSNFINSLYATRSLGLLDDKGSQLLNAGDSLYNWLWAPLTKHLKNISSVYYSPAGIMHRVAFAALPYQKGKLLAQKYSLNLVSSTRDIGAQKPALTGKAVFIGGIDYAANSANNERTDTAFSRSFESYVGLNSSLVWTNLPGTYEETKALSGLYANKQTLWVTGGDASEEFIKSIDTLSPAILHIATHGYFLPDNTGRQTDPLLRSGLVFAGANNKQKTTADDGLFTAFEASNVNLSSVELLVLSACETGLGEVQGSQGVYGLQRAFKMAGVKNIVMSLWQVPDKETSEFMQEFYKRLQAKVPLQKAFADTQLYMAAKHPPFYWAAFVLLQ